MAKRKPVQETLEAFLAFFHNKKGLADQGLFADEKYYLCDFRCISYTRGIESINTKSFVRESFDRSPINRSEAAS